MASRRRRLAELQADRDGPHGARDIEESLRLTDAANPPPARGPRAAAPAATYALTTATARCRGRRPRPELPTTTTGGLPAPPAWFEERRADPGCEADGGVGGAARRHRCRTAPRCQAAARHPPHRPRSPGPRPRAAAPRRRPTCRSRGRRAGRRVGLQRPRGMHAQPVVCKQQVAEPEDDHQRHAYAPAATTDTASARGRPHDVDGAREARVERVDHPQHLDGLRRCPAPACRRAPAPAPPERHARRAATRSSRWASRSGSARSGRSADAQPVPEGPARRFGQAHARRARWHPAVHEHRPSRRQLREPAVERRRDLERLLRTRRVAVHHRDPAGRVVAVDRHPRERPTS